MKLYALPPGDTKGPEGPKKKNLKGDVVEVKQQNKTIILITVIYLSLLIGWWSCCRIITKCYV
jgi:hypothetical protein